jgi:hypothetical protein
MNVVMLSALSTDHFIPQEIFLVPIYVGGRDISVDIVAGWSGDRILVEKKFFAHPASCTMGNVFPGGKPAGE